MRFVSKPLLVFKRLEKGENMISSNNIISIRGLDGNIIKMEIYSSLPSVTDLTREYAKNGYPDRYAVFSERQYKSPLTGSKSSSREFEYGMFLSLILRPSFFPAQASLLGALSATAMITALEEHTTKNLGLGWVSDIYCEGEKCGSVAIEGKLDDYTAYEYLIVTFAIRLENKNFPPRLTDIISEVFEKDNTSIPVIIAKNVINKFLSFYTNIKTSNAFMSIYKSRFALIGASAKYEVGDKKRNCTIFSVEDDGSIKVDVSGTKITIRSPSQITMPKRYRVKPKAT